MKLIDREWIPELGAYQHLWLADRESDITAGFDPEGAAGSAIQVIETKSTYMKNTEGKWQKVGTTEVIG